MIVDFCAYVKGQRIPDTSSVEEAVDRARASSGFVWIGLYEPTQEEFDKISRIFSLHPLAVEDSVHAHQRPKTERYDTTLFVVLKTAQYKDREEVIELGEIMMFVGSDFVVSVRHGTSTALSETRHALESAPERLAIGPLAVLHAIADKVADDYGIILTGLNTDIDQIGEDVFSSSTAGHTNRIFSLKREVLEFGRAVDPMTNALDDLARVADSTHELAEYFRDVRDHTVRASEQLAALDGLLDSALQANVAQIGIRQNEDMRKISAWVAIAAVPTMIASIYGMNFENMPELKSEIGYPVVLAFMVAISFALYKTFKHRDWL